MWTHILANIRHSSHYYLVTSLLHASASAAIELCTIINDSIIEILTFTATTLKWTCFTIYIWCMQCYLGSFTTEPKSWHPQKDTDLLYFEYMTSKLASLFGFKGGMWLHSTLVFFGVRQICRHIQPRCWASGV